MRAARRRGGASDRHFPKLWKARENLREPWDRALCGVVGGRSGFELKLRAILHWRPLSQIFDVAPKLLETERLVRTEKDIDASVALAAFDAGENEPGLINSL
jgi:hypothetical protein